MRSAAEGDARVLVPGNDGRLAIEPAIDTPAAGLWSHGSGGATARFACRLLTLRPGDPAELARLETLLGLVVPALAAALLGRAAVAAPTAAGTPGRGGAPA